MHNLSSRHVANRRLGFYGTLCDAPKRSLRERPGAFGRFGVHVQFENARHRDDGLRPIAILGQREFERIGLTDEQATATAILVLNDPVSVAVFANQEKRRIRGPALTIVHVRFLSAKSGCDLTRRAAPGRSRCEEWRRSAWPEPALARRGRSR